MTSYAYKARNETGRVVRGNLQAQSKEELFDQLAAKRLFLVKSRRIRRPAKLGRGRVKDKELIIFTFQLQTLVSSGVPLLTGLDDLANQMKRSTFKDVITGIRSSVEGGSTLSQALEHYPKAFSPSYIRMVEAGETSGRLDTTLDRLLVLLERRVELNAQIRQLATYPLIVLSGVLGLIVLLMAFVIPKFRGMLDALNVELPWVTKAVLAMSDFFVHNGLLIGIGAGAAIAGFTALRKVPRVKYFLDSAVLKVPVIGDLILILNSNRILHFLQAFIETGVPIGISLDMLSRISENMRFGVSIQRVRTKILEGETMTRAFQTEGVFPPLVQRMIAIGEETGELPSALEKVQQYYDRELPHRVKKIFDLVGPLTTVALGVVLLFVILAVLLPVYKMYSAINVG
ncbi:MAG: type II secretion system F family protein [Candidatus Eisenbacteria bacterium]|uniref:Type II secretion system F family protein n=1 Tax=Eiseniibacteriota bacterium TaxID=2212470 RepID=A0A948RW06_UNCEI|nr:type II secretion system F family protein [Candidatus Eisenbacteria bacterium]MBU1949910.1 type II secretion system F family protein [Candidatus Eisenbacteria bacterium]MBU2690012.1 type II secretion system F family protein [Candidatus Eisenbacteria bacterium]